MIPSSQKVKDVFHSFFEFSPGFLPQFAYKTHLNHKDVAIAGTETSAERDWSHGWTTAQRCHTRGEEEANVVRTSCPDPSLCSHTVLSSLSTDLSPLELEAVISS